MSSKKQDDERFVRVQKDPRFWEMPEREQKIRIDQRFKSMFSDQRFKVKYTVDKRGRPISHTSTEDLKRFYKVSDSEEEEEEEERVREKKVKKGGAEKPEKVPQSLKGLEEDSEDEPSGQGGADGAGVSGSSDEDEEESEVSGSEDSDSGPDLARGKGNVESSSEDEEDEVDVVLRREEEEMEHAWGDLCKDAPRADEVSARLAVCNMDWDRLKARDLLVLLRSFSPPGGAVLSVKIYPSEFGKERLKVEETQGPPELRSLPNDSEDDTEEEKVYREKMRDYQFKRRKYFYAVVECDSVSTATAVYQECDGYEYESSCCCLDLRFIPDDVTFDEEPKDVATDVNVAAYTPKLFTSSGTTTSKVQLTWDETDHERVTAMSRKFDKDELLDMDFRAYLASSSEEEEEEEAAPQQSSGDATKEKKNEEQMGKYRELLRGIQEKEKKLQEDKHMEMEVTWVPGLKETTEQLVRKKLEQQQLTPWEEFLQKKKEKKKLRRCQKKQEEEESSEEELPADVDLSDPFFAEELAETHPKKVKGKKKKKEEEQTAEEQEQLQKQKEQMMLLMDEDDKRQHFNYDKIVEQQNLSKKKRKKMMRKGEELLDQDDFQVDVTDPRFQAMFTSHLFNLDPTHPAYRNTRATHSLLREKQRRRGRGQDEEGRDQEEEGRDQEPEDWAQQQEGRDQKQNGRGQQLKRRGQQQEELVHHHEGPSQQETTPPEEAETRMDPGLSVLVRSIKKKTEEFQKQKKQKVSRV